MPVDVIAEIQAELAKLNRRSKSRRIIDRILTHAEEAYKTWLETKLAQLTRQNGPVMD